MPRMRWIRLWTQETLYGTTNRELALEERAIWFEMLALAGDSPTPGIICISPGVSFTDAQLSQILGAPEELIRQAIVKLTSPSVSKIRVNGSGLIQIVNWERYQSEFDKTEYQREYMRRYRKRKTNECKTNERESIEQTGTEGRGGEYPLLPHPTPPHPVGGAQGPHSFNGWLEKVNSSQNKTGALGEMIAALSGHPVDYSRLGKMIKGRDAAFICKLVWDMASTRPVGDWLNYLQGMIRKGASHQKPLAGELPSNEDHLQEAKEYERAG